MIDQKPEIVKKISDETDNILKSKNIEDALKLLVSGTGLQYQKLRNDFYIIKLKKEPQKEEEVPEKKNRFEGGEKTIDLYIGQKFCFSVGPFCFGGYHNCVLGGQTDYYTNR